MRNSALVIGALLGFIAPAIFASSPPLQARDSRLQFFNLKKNISDVDRPGVIWVKIRKADRELVLERIRQLGFVSRPRSRSNDPNWLEMDVDPFDWPRQWKELSQMVGIEVIEPERYIGERGGSDATFIVFSKATFPSQDKPRIYNRISDLSDQMISSLFSGKSIEVTPQNTSLPNVKRYTVVGLSRDMRLHIRNGWESYRIEMTYFPSFCRKRSIVAMSFVLTEQKVARFREDARPPAARFQESNYETVNKTAASLSYDIGKRFGGSQYDWHNDTYCD